MGYELRIYYEDTDVGGIVYHANYIKYCERARSEMFFQNNIPLMQNGCHFVVANLCAKFVKPAFLGDLLCVRTKTLSIKKASAKLEQNIYKDDELIFSMNLNIAYTKEGKPTRMSDILIDFFTRHI